MALIGDASELDTLLYGGKYMLPEAASYTMTTPWGVVSSDVSGGFVRQQLQFFNSPAQVQVVYRCVTKARVDYLKAFIRLHEGLPFIAALAVDTDTVEPYIVDVVGAPTWQENGFSGTCTLTYQVQPTPNADYDEFLQWSGAALGDDTLDFANWIAKTANWDLPDAKQMPIDATGTTAAFVSDLYYSNNTQVSFHDLVTFSRLSAGSYIDTDGVLKTAAIGEPRFEAGGLLVEPQSANLFTESGYQPVWSVNAPASSTLEAIGFAEFGNEVFGKLTATSTASASRYVWLPQIIGLTSDSTYTISAWVYVPINSQVSSIRIGSNDFNIIATIVPITKGVLNSVSHTSTLKVDKNSIKPFVWGYKEGATAFSTVVGEVLFSTGAIQAEAIPFATSYIKTTGVAVTRASDSAAVDMQPHAAGTIFAEFLSDAVAIERVVYTAGGVTLSRLATMAISVTTGAVTVTSAVVPSGSVKTAISYDGATLKRAVNGTVYSAASALPSVGVSIVLGNTTFANVWQRSEAYDNARLVEVTQ